MRCSLFSECAVRGMIVTGENKRPAYAREKFSDAVGCLAGAADIRSRLDGAQTAIMMLRTEDLPLYLQEKFDDVRSKRWSVSGMDDAKCKALAEEISSIYAALIKGI
jgi:hypothetical protein